MRKFVAALIVAALAAPAGAQVSYTGSNIFQDFNTLPTSGTTNPWASNVTLVGYFVFQSNGTQATSIIRAGDGTSNAGALYSFGTGTDTERAFGTIASGTPGNFAYGIVVQNNTGVAQDFTVAYTGEQWRDGGAATPNPQTVSFSYRTSATLPTTAAEWDPSVALPVGYNSLSSLDFTSPVFTNTGSGTALDGNLPQNQVVFPTTTIPVLVNPGEFLTLRWFDLNHVGNDHGLGIDNITIAPVPEPATVLGIAALGLGAGGYVRRRWSRAKA